MDYTILCSATVLLSSDTMTQSRGLDGIEEHLGHHTARDFFSYVRGTYLAAHGIVKAPSPQPTLHAILVRVAAEFGVSPHDVWSSPQFQLVFRATKPEHLRSLGVSEDVVAVAHTAVRAGRCMSILPYNAAMPQTTLAKYIPSRPERYTGTWRHSIDPYGIFRQRDRIIARDAGNEVYLGTRKFPYAVLAHQTESCPIGCDGCYKGAMARTSLAALADIYPEYSEIKKQLGLDEQHAVRRAALLTRWLNNHPEVDTIIVSGGEPTLFSTPVLKKILGCYAEADHVDVVRLCTSCIYQGMWYRMDKELVGTLAAFGRRKRFYINAHVTDQHQLMAPEAGMAVDALRQAGITVHLQMPLQQGVNFDRNDLGWTRDTLRAVSKQAYVHGVIPYKMIVDMHSSSHPSLTVPLETVTRLGCFEGHTSNSDQERWQACEILHEQGNAYLYPFPHFAAMKEIDPRERRVTYFIPVVGSTVAIHTYEEPLIEGHNDKPDSVTISDAAIRTKADDVRHAYHTLRARAAQLSEGLTLQEQARALEPLEREFDALSGIPRIENEPLVV